MEYYFSKEINTDFSTAENRVRNKLQEEGFGVLTEIDIQSKLNEKLGVEFPKYKILGACNPPYAYKALKVENKIGTMLPCNVILQELDNDKIEVAAINPIASMMAIENKELSEIAQEITKKLKSTIDQL